MSARLALLVAVFFISAAAPAGLVPAAEDPIVGDYGRCALPARTGGPAKRTAKPSRPALCRAATSPRSGRSRRDA